MTTDDYTPDDAEVRRAYTVGMRQAFITSAGAHGEEFDRWLAAHDARVKAKALRDAAQARPRPKDMQNGWQEWLNICADTIEKEAGA